MYKILLVGIGGFVGAILRYLIGGWVQQSYPNFPAGTMVVNLVGSFLISFIMFGSEIQGFFTDNTRIFLAIGIMGSFTTMSSFNYETFRLIEQNELVYAFWNIFGNIMGGLLAIFLGRLSVIAIWS